MIEKEFIDSNVLILMSILFLNITLIGLAKFILDKNYKKYIGRKPFDSNKFIRIIEVTSLVMLLVILGNEFLSMYHVIYTSIGLVLLFFTFFQRVSNKDRRFAYIGLCMSFVLCIVFKLIV